MFMERPAGCLWNRWPDGSREREDSEKVTCATFSFVALDHDGRPRSVMR